MALDYAGISIGTLGCYVPGVFYAFYCNNVRNITYIWFMDVIDGYLTSNRNVLYHVTEQKCDLDLCSRGQCHGKSIFRWSNTVVLNNTKQQNY